MGSHEGVSSNVKLSLKTIAGNSVSKSTDLRSDHFRDTRSYHSSSFPDNTTLPRYHKALFFFLKLDVSSIVMLELSIFTCTDTPYLLDGYDVLRQWSFNSSKSWIRRIVKEIFICADSSGAFSSTRPVSVSILTVSTVSIRILSSSASPSQRSGSLECSSSWMRPMALVNLSLSSCL
ncbi:hypothetical protein Tco_0731618 [Tanacetum coccineum]